MSGYSCFYMNKFVCLLKTKNEVKKNEYDSV
ncbi:MAG: hypothetical protein ACFWUD_08910 [Thermocaproicibacter melissae]|jgi:hypothetical protein